MKLLKIIKGKTFVEVKEFLYQTYQLQTKEDTEFKNLYMIVFPKVETAEFEKLVKENPLIEECRSVILEKETNHVICPGVSSQKEYQVDKNLSEYGFHYNQDKEKMYIQEVYEGTCIRMYHYDGEWRTATNRCLNAKNAKWENEKTFHQYFLEAIEPMKVNYENFVKSHSHTFLVQHPDNYGVFVVPKPNLYYLSSKMGTTEDIFPAIQIPRPSILTENPSSFQEFYERYITQEQKLLGRAGFILKDMETGISLRVMNPIYLEANELRGNVTRDNLIFWYVKLKKEGKVKRYLDFFMEDGVIFRKFENDLDDMYQKIHQEYCAKFVNKSLKMNELTFGFRPLIYKLNGEYLKARTQKITKNRIREYIWSNLVPEQITYLYNSHMKRDVVPPNKV